LLQSQVKFYDFVFKTITVLLAISAILVYKDRQDMKNQLENDYRKMVIDITKKAGSLITTANNKLQTSITKAESSTVLLQKATNGAKNSKKESFTNKTNS